MYYDELLRLCGYEQDEIEEERPRFEKVWERLELGPEDFDRGIENLKRDLDVELEGVRGLLRIEFEEMVDGVLARDEYKKVVFTSHAGGNQPIWAMKLAAPSDTYVGWPDHSLNMIMGAIFNKLTPIMEVAEEHALRLGFAHCAINQCYEGAIRKGILPAPDLAVVFSGLCDQPIEMWAAIAFDYPTIEIVPMDTFTGVVEKGELFNIRPELLHFGGDGVRYALKRFEEFTGARFTPELTRQARIMNGMFYREMAKIAELYAKADPPPLKASIQELMFWAAMEPKLQERSERSVNAIRTLYRETAERVEKGEGVMKLKGAPKVSGSCFGFNADFTPYNMMADVGLNYATYPWNWLVPRDYEPPTFKDYGEHLIEGFFRKAIFINAEAHAKYISEIAQLIDAEGVIIGVGYNCRIVGPWCIIEKKLVEEETGLPVLLVEFDMYDTRYITTSVMRTRLETFADILRERRTAKEGAR